MFRLRNISRQPIQPWVQDDRFENYSASRVALFGRRNEGNSHNRPGRRIQNCKQGNRSF
jgi:hypothetical protein